MQISLKTYVQESILPRYDAFDAAHQRDHAQMVISRALDLAEFYPVDKEMIYVSAAYHDLGLVAGRENHHLVSGEILRNDARLLEWFSASQIETMAQAAEDHRASAQREPRSIYGKIIAEADRLIDPILVIERTLQYGRKHYPQLSKEEHFNRAIQHLHEKYGPQGYLKLWIPESPNAVALKKLHVLMADDAKLRAIMESLF